MLTLCLLTATASGEDWPRWRGPRGDGTWRGPKLPDRWPEEGLRRIWRRPIGGGYAGVVVVDGRVFTMDLEKGSPDRERVLCLDADSGKSLWSHAYPVDYGDMDHGNGPRAAVTVADDRVYSLGAVGHVRCLDARTGRVIWGKDLVEEDNARIPTWGLAASPVIFEDKVIIHAGARPDGCLQAFDRKTGKEQWRSLSDPAGYATPILIQRPGGPQLIAWTPENIQGVDPRDGKSLWSVPYKVNLGVSIATPIHHDSIVLVAGYWEGAKAIRLGDEPTDVGLLWEENRFLRGLMSQPLVRDGYAYLIDKRYGLTCFELRTGKKKWDAGNAMTPKGRNPQATKVWIGEGDRVLVLNSDGELILARFSPAGYAETSRAKIIGPTWAHPAYAGGRVYARNDTEIVCVSLLDAEAF